MNQNSFNLLLIEDDQGDIELTQEALAESKIAVQIHTTEDGIKALQCLRKESPYQDFPTPHLILLDLNLPKKDGREVLKEIKSDPNLKRIPVIILTSSKAEEDVLKTYDLGANCYVTKPVGLEAFAKIVRAVEDFWFSIVILPNKNIQELTHR